MVELTEAFRATLADAGIHVRAAREAGLHPRLKHSAVAVSVAQLRTSPGGFSAYLGIRDGQELYGLRLQAQLRLDVLSPVGLGAAGCRTAVDAACAALAGGVEGVSISSVVSYDPAYDKVIDCFAAVIEVECRGWLCAVPSAGEPETLEHFILKGALT